MRLKNLSDKLNALDKMGRLIPISLNYHDLSLNRPEEEWADYQIFTQESGNDFGFGGISHPDGAFNIYATDAKAAQAVADEMLGATNNQLPPAIRGGQATASLLDQHPVLGVTPLNLKRFFHYYAAPKDLPAIDLNGHRLRKAVTEDADFIKYWGETYNAELGESFAIVQPNEIEQKKIYILMSPGNEPIGGYYRTILNSDRFWRARLFIKPEVRRQGIARLILQAVFDQFTTHKEIHVNVVDTNKPAISFWDKYGTKTNETAFNAKLR